MKAMEQQDDRMDKIDKPRDAGLARCLEPRPRTNSLDQLTSQAIAKILSIFKSSSSSDAGSTPGPLAGSSIPTRGGARGSGRLSKSRSADSSVGGSQPPRRRFMRVVRDENAPPPGTLDENPHIIPHYSQKYLVAHYNQKSAEEDLSLDKQPRALPYVTSGHTILKKSSGDQMFLGAGETQAEASPAATQKHASFFAEVEVIEYNLADKVVSPNHCSHILPLRDSDDDDEMTLEATIASAYKDETEPGWRDSVVGAAKSVSFFTSHDVCDATADEMRTNQSDESTEDGKMAVVGEGEACQVDAAEIETVKISKTEAADTEAAKSEGAKSEAANAEGMMRNIFSAIVTLDSAGMQVSKAQEPPTKHIRLADLINAPKSSGAKS